MIKSFIILQIIYIDLNERVFILKFLTWLKTLVWIID